MAIVRKARYLNMSILFASGFTMPFWKTICVSLFVCTCFSVTIIIVRYSKVVVSVLHLLLSHRISKPSRLHRYRRGHGFKSLVHYCLSDVHHCDDRSHIPFFIRSSHIWFSYIHSQLINVIKSRPVQAYKEIDSDNNNRDLGKTSCTKSNKQIINIE